MATALTSSASGAETHFAKKLASNEKTVRDKAVKKLRIWLSSSRSVATGLSEEDMLKLWKGIFYCMWMSDKPKIQEELAETVAQLLNNFVCIDSAFKFLAGFFKTMYREWHGIDRLRMDKFYLLIRKFVYHSIFLLKNNSWDKKVLSKLNQVLENGPLNPISYSAECANGVQVHVIQVYLEELFKHDHNGLRSSAFLQLLEPFSSLLATSRSHVITRCISQSIFNSLLEKDKESEKTDNCCKVDFYGLAEQLFSLASRKDIQGRNRNILYNYYNKFKKASVDQKEDPGLMDNVQGEEVMSDIQQLPDGKDCNGKESAEPVSEKPMLVNEQLLNGDNVDKMDEKCDMTSQDDQVKERRKRRSERISKAKNKIEDEKHSDVKIYNLRGASEKSKRKKSEDTQNNNVLENSKPSEKRSQKKKRRNSDRKNEPVVEDSVMVNHDESTEDNTRKNIQQEVENLDGSYLGTILSSQTTCHENDDKCLTPESLSSVKNQNQAQSSNYTSSSDAMVTNCDVETSSKSSCTPQGKTTILSNEDSSEPQPVAAAFLRHSVKKAKVKGRKKSERKKTPESIKKQVRIELSKNTSQTTKDYHLTLQSSPVVPFDASKKPSQSSLKTPPSANSSKKVSRKRPTSADFF